MVRTLAAYSDQWEGDFLLGLCFDMGLGRPLDHEKAMTYYQKAGQYVHAAAPALEQEWYDTFMSSYREFSHGNAILDLPERVRRMRRIGYAALSARTAGPYQELTGEPYYNFPVDWGNYFSAVPHGKIKLFGKNDLEDYAISDTNSSLEILSFGTVDANERAKRWNSYQKSANLWADEIGKEIDECQKKKIPRESLANPEKPERYLKDYDFLLLGISFLTLKPCPYDFMEIAENSGRDVQGIGVEFLTRAVRHGSTCALGLLADLSRDPDVDKMIRSTYRISSLDMTTQEALAKLYYSASNPEGIFRRSDFAFDTPQERQAFEAKLGI